MMDHSHCSPGSHNGGSHISENARELVSNNGNSHMPYQGLQHTSTEDSHISRHGGSHMSGGHQISHHGAKYITCLGGHQMTPHGGHHISHHGSHQIPNHAGKHMSYHGGHHMSHHGSEHIFPHGNHHTSNHGSHHMTNYGDHNNSNHMSHHGVQHSSNHTDHEMVYNRGNHMFHHGDDHMSRHEGHHMPTHGGDYHGGHHMSHHGGQHASHNGIHYMAHQRGHQLSNHGGHQMSTHGGHYIAHHGGHHMSHQMSHHVPHYRSHHRKTSNHKTSVHGGSASKEVSKYSSLKHKNGSGFSHGGHCHGSHSSSHAGQSTSKINNFLGANEKQIMQVLNERLSTYLGTVHTLEQKNAKLERNISEWYENNTPQMPPDGTHYFKIIAELQSKIGEVAKENSSLILALGNAKLAADDFKGKYEIELQFSESAMTDVNHLGGVLEALNGETAEFETHVQSLEEELQDVKTSNEEDIDNLLGQLGARVNVEVNAAPSIDLNTVLSEVRGEYENLMDQNLKEAEEMFRQRSEELNREVVSGSEQLQSFEMEIIEMKRNMQALEIELQSEMSMNSALEGTLEEIQDTFGSKLEQLQSVINDAESELGQIRSDLEHQNNDYKILMDQKTHLEMEIATYKRLLDGHDITVTGHQTSGEQVFGWPTLRERHIQITLVSSCTFLHGKKQQSSASRQAGSARASSDTLDCNSQTQSSILGPMDDFTKVFRLGLRRDGVSNQCDKETMQLLNDRLATYMEKVQSLEQGNSQLENKINDWYTKNTPRSLPDSRPYLSTIQDLQTQILETTMKNGSISLEVDNAKWAADDFKNKYDIELRLKDSVERDVKGLRQALAWLKMETNDLEIQVQNLQEEDQEIKKNHEQEVTALKSQMGQRVNVEVNAAPSRDLNKTLDEIRQQYENLMERNLKEVESMFLARSEDLNRQVVSASEQLQSVQTVNIDLKRKIQTLEIDLESQLSMNAALQDSLAETEATYSSQLQQIQKMVDQMEAELSEIRYDLERQNSEYKKLMDQKTHLEMEIATYKRLLEGNNIKGKSEKVTFSIADKMKSSTVSLSSTDEQDKKISSVTEELMLEVIQNQLQRSKETKTEK
ncbi:keratin, type I cytoskeletal 19 [Pelobates cultripes]|uniref:Keratin, type I cytoskeletal 19 n=1 Tax=Pelobates cultripes TaxID=61616 RepID=A0AAD1SMF8_PELCU|nr:keratin, type I cytoskeletal 19 [Pelobates cultripes]